MSVVDASRDRYASLKFLSTYIDAEWGDILIRADSCRRDELVPFSSGSFYREVGHLTSTWAEQIGIAPERICDIGGGTGRMTHELALRFPNATELILAEPSESFCEWAYRFLKGREFDSWIPVPFRKGEVKFCQIDFANLPTPDDRIIIHNVPSNLIPRRHAYFNLITCLNVIDRVERPELIVKDISRLLMPGGLMVLASPFDFEEQFTPKDKWISELVDLLDHNSWDINEEHIKDVSYDFSYYERHHLRFVSQVVGARKKP